PGAGRMATGPQGPSSTAAGNLGRRMRGSAMRARRTTMPVTVGALAICFAVGPFPSLATDVDQNTTGLPTYPHLRRAVMDPVARSTLGRRCTHFAAESRDPLGSGE